MAYLPQLAVVATLVVLLIHIPHSHSKGSPGGGMPTLHALPRQNNEFTLQLYRRLISKTRGNIFFSPISIMLTMGLLSEGTAGTTKDQILHALTIDMLQGEPLRDQVLNLLVQYHDETNNYTLSLANKIYSKSGYEFSPAYLTDMETYYEAGAEALDFSGAPEASRTTINDWVEENTGGRIQNLLQSGTIDQNTMMVLVNAIYFYGPWATPFDEADTRRDMFHLSDTEGFDVDMMSIKSMFRYKDMPSMNASILELPYEGGEVAMYILLPTGVDTLPNLEAQLNYTTFAHMFKGMRKTEVMLKMPRFDMTQEMNLGQILQEMGVLDAFDGRKADFSPLAANSRGLALSEVIHKAFINVDEAGTEAAGSTAGVITLTSLRPTVRFTVNRPFMFFIREIPTGAVLFYGRFNELPANTRKIGTFGFRVDSVLDNGAEAMHAPASVFITVVACLVVKMLH